MKLLSNGTLEVADLEDEELRGFYFSRIVSIKEYINELMAFYSEPVLDEPVKGSLSAFYAIKQLAVEYRDKRTSKRQFAAAMANETIRSLLELDEFENVLSLSLFQLPLTVLAGIRIYCSNLLNFGRTDSISDTR